MNDNERERDAGTPLRVVPVLLCELMACSTSK